MRVTINFSQTIDQITKNLNEIERQLVPQVTVRALNRTAANLRTVAVQQMAENSGLKQSILKRSMIITNAKLSNKIASVIAKYQSINLIYFKGTRAKQGGVVSSAFGKNKLYEGAFIATMPNKFRGVFIAIPGRYQGLKRVKTGKNIGKSYRSSKVKQLFGPSPSGIFKFLDKFNTAFTRERFISEFHSDLRFRLSKLKSSKV